MALVAAQIGPDRKAVPPHLGGGTPTFFSAAELDAEIDPHTVGDGTLAALGFNRNSFGVQAFDPAVHVQRAGGV